MAVKFGEEAPVERRAQVMSGVIAIVQEQPIGETAGDVAGMVEGGIVVAILMLQEIDGDDAPLAEQPGDAQI